MNTQERIKKIQDEASSLAVRLYNIEEERDNIKTRLREVTIEFMTLKSVEETQKAPDNNKG